MQGQTPRESSTMSPSSVGQFIPSPVVRQPRLWRGPKDVFWRIMGFLGPQRSQLTLMPLSRDAVVISPSFRAAVRHEAVIRQDHLHSAKQASRKLSLTGGVSLVLCFRPGQLRDLQCHNPVSVRSQLQRKTLKT